MLIVARAVMYGQQLHNVIACNIMTLDDGVYRANTSSRNARDTATACHDMTLRLIGNPYKDLAPDWTVSNDFHLVSNEGY